MRIPQVVGDECIVDAEAFELQASAGGKVRVEQAGAQRGHV